MSEIPDDIKKAASDVISKKSPTMDRYISPNFTPPS